MELLDGYIKIDHEQEVAIITAMHQVNEEQGYELEEPMELASDLLRRLHELGYYVARCGDTYEPQNDGGRP